MERRILKTLDVNQLAKTSLAEFLDHISIEGNADVNLEEVHISSLYLIMKINLYLKYRLDITLVALLLALNHQTVNTLSIQELILY